MISRLIVAALRAIRKPFSPKGGYPLTRRHAEAMNQFTGLHARLARENKLHAIMLSQRIFRK